MRSLTLIIWIVIGSNFCFAQGKHAKDSIEISKILFQQQTAWNNADLAGFMGFYWNNESLKFVSKNGIKYGWQPVYDGYKKNYLDKGEMGKLLFEIKSFDHIDKQNAILVGGWKVVNTNGSPQGYFTLWFRKIHGKWLIVMDHTS